MSTPTITLKPTGQAMPLIGLGTWKVPNSSCTDIVYDAIKSGYRLIDCAQDYGNEKECGQGVRRAIDEGIIERKDIFITSKLWNTFHSKEHAVSFAKKSLSYWGLEYFDLFLIHFPIAQKYVDPSIRYPPSIVANEETDVVEFENVPLSETWSALESLVDSGLVKNIGVCNFNAGLLRDLLNYSRIKPAVLQIEHHPYLTQPALIDFAMKNDVAVTGYSTFGPQSFLELDHKVAQKTTPLLQHDKIKSIAETHHKTPAQVILRWATQRNIAVIPKSNHAERGVQNLKSIEFDLSKHELDQISDLDVNLRYNDPKEWPGSVPIF